MSCYKKIDLLNKNEKKAVKDHNSKQIKDACRNARSEVNTLGIKKNEEWTYDYVNKAKAEAREIENRNTVPTVLPVSTEFAKSAEVKRNARMQFTIRQKTILPPGVKHRHEISPVLDMLTTPEMSAIERLETYSAKHKCSHNRSFNQYKIDNNRWFVPKCDHQYESIGNVLNEKCKRCSAKQLRVIHRVCGCQGVYCERCRFAFYVNEYSGTVLPLGCSCHLELCKLQKEAEYKISIFKDGCFDHTLLENNIAEFLNRTTKVNARAMGTFANRVKKESIKDFLSREEKTEEPQVVPVNEYPTLEHDLNGKLTETPKPKRGNFKKANKVTLKEFLKEEEVVEVQQEGGQISSLATNAKNGVSSALNPIIDALKSIRTSIVNWLNSITPQCVKDCVSSVRFFTMLVRVLGSVLNALLSKSPLDLVMWGACLAGSKTQKCLAISTLIIEAMNEFFDEETWYGKVLETLCQSVDESMRAWKVTPRNAIQEAKLVVESAIAVYLDQSLNLPNEFEEFLQILVNHTIPACKNQAAILIDYTKHNPKMYLEDQYRMQKNQVKNEGLQDMLSSVILLLPREFHYGMFKTLAMFCKDILPMIYVVKNAFDFTKKIKSWLLKIFGFHTENTREWIELEMQDKESPLRLAATAAFDYKLMANADHPEAYKQLIVAKEARANLALYLKEENRFDPHTMRFTSEVDKMIASTSLPPQSRKHEPFCVRIYGEPGTGKSTYVPVLFGPILGVKNKDEFYQKTFSRNMGEYWDGVGTRQCILYDDFGQNRTEPTDLMELILLVSAAPFMANFANITGTTPKGMSIDPKIVVACSNTSSDYTSSLSDNGAVQRRFHLTLKCKKEMGLSYFCVAGGSLTSVSENLLPLTEWMTPQDMQLYLYNAFQVFTLSRGEGTKKLDTVMTRTECVEPLLKYDADGKATAVVAKDISVFNTYFASVAKNLRPVPNPNDLFEPRVSDLKQRQQRLAATLDLDEVTQNSGFSDFLDIWGSTALCHYTAFLYGLCFASAFRLAFSDPKGIRQFIHAMSCYLVPAITSGVAAFYLWKSITRVEPESSTAKGKAAPKAVSAESGSAAVMDVQAVLEKATCRLRAADGSMVVNAILVGGTSFLTVEHAFIPPVKDEVKEGLYVPEGTDFLLYINNVAEPLNFKFERSRMKPITKKIEGNFSEVDAVIYTLPNSAIPYRKKIATRFWQGEILLKDKKSYVLDFQNATRTQLWKESTLTAEQSVYYVQNGKKWIQHLVHGTHASGPGSCGSPVMLATGETNAAIVGIHIAKHPQGTPMILTITREMIERSMPGYEALDPPNIDTRHTIAEVTQEASLLDDTTLLHLGRTKRRMFTATNTTLRPSLLAGVIQPPQTEPSVLSNRDPRIPEEIREKVDLHRDGILKMKQPIQLTYEDLIPVKGDMIEWYMVKFSEKKMTIQSPLSMREVLNGNEVLKTVDLTTSCGYPFTFEGKEKSDVLLRDQNMMIVGTFEFYKQLYRDLLEIKEGRVPQWFVTGNLKDERRPIEKVRVKPKTRLFTVCPLIMICLEKMYFGPFMKMLLSSDNIPYAGGVDRMGISWHYMFADLRSVSDKGFGGDYQCYDGSLSEGLITSSLEIMEAALDPSSLQDPLVIRPSETDGNLDTLRTVQTINDLEIKHYEVLKAVKQALANPVYLLKDIVFQSVGTLTSGCWTTQLVGTLSNELMLRSAWNDLVPKHCRGGYFYKKFVQNKIMSDDNINSVETSALRFFNGETYSRWLKDRGMVYTSAKKDGDAAAVEPLEDISFLKNTTGLMKGYYCPLMDQTAAIEISNWIRLSKFITEHEATEMNANSTLRAMFFYGPNNFNFIRKRFLSTVPTLKLVDWNTLLHQYLNYGGFPGTQPDAVAFSEEMNIMPREPELIEMNTLQKVESSSSEASNSTRLSADTSDAERLQNMIEVQQEGKTNYPCAHCNQVFVSINRLVDHMVAVHQKKNQEFNDIYEFFQNSTQAEFKELYTELMGSNLSPKTKRVMDLATKESFSKTQIITTLNNMLSYVSGKLDARKAANFNEGGLSMQNLFISLDAAPKPKQKVDIDTLLDSVSMAIRSELEDGYEVLRVVQESGEGDFHQEEEGGVVHPDEVIFTNPSQDIDIKDPVDETRSVDNQQGTVLTDKGRVDRVKVKGTGFNSPRAQTTLNDQAWNLEQMLKKWHPITDVKWTTAESINDHIYVGNVLKDIIKSGFAGTAFAAFKDFRCAGVKIKAVMVGSKWHQGRCLLSFAPTMVSNTVAAFSRDWTIADALQTGSVKLDPSVGGTTEFYIPFRHVKTHLTLEEDDCLGQLHLTILSPLRVSSSASQEVTIKLFFCIDNPIFKIPRANAITFAMMSELSKRVQNRLPVATSTSRIKSVLVTQEGGGVKKSIDDKGQPAINEYPAEGTHISAERAMTGDPPKRHHFGEMETNLINHCKRYRKVAETRANTTNVGNWEVFEISNFISSFWPLFMFNAYRGAMNLKIFVTYGQTGQTGFPALTEVFYEPQPTDDTKAQNAFAAYFTDPYRAVTRSRGGCVEIQIPFYHRSGISLMPMFYKDSFQATGPYIQRGKLYVRHSTLPATGFRITTIFASLADEFGVGIYRGVPNCRFDTTYPGFAPITRIEKQEEVKQEGLLDGLADAGLELIKEKLVPKDVIGGVLSCLDKPAIPTMPEFFTSKDGGFMNFSEGPEPIDKFAVHPRCQQLVDPEHFGSAKNEADLNDLFERPNYLGAITWKSTNESQDLLTSFNVSPMVEFELARPSGKFRPQLLTYLASKFKYWRGGMTFIFEVVGTNFQEGRLDFSFHPNTSIVPSDYETRMSQYAVSCSVKNTENRFAITVPYLAEEPFRRVHNGESYSEPSAVESPPACTEFHSGALAVSVGAKLGLPDNVPGEVEILVFYKPAADFELNHITMDKRSLVEQSEA